LRPSQASDAQVIRESISEHLLLLNCLSLALQRHTVQ
jgi:hypothetical protein